MSCSCHKKQGHRVATTLPTDQCTACARKHTRDAWSAYTEFPYEVANREFVAGQLRDAMRHLMYDHRETALRCRDLAMTVEEAQDASVPGGLAAALDALRAEVLQLFFDDHPEVGERLERLQKHNAITTGD